MFSIPLSPLSPRSFIARNKEKTKSSNNTCYGINFDPIDVTDKDTNDTNSKNNTNIINPTFNLSEPFETTMTSKTSSKKKHPPNTVRGKDGVQWLVDKDGNKIKKVRKKKPRRRASISGVTVDPSDLMGSVHSSSGSGGIPPESFRTVATELSSSHRSQFLGRNGLSPKQSSSKSSPRSRSHREVNSDQWWHVDDIADDIDIDNTPVKKARKKVSASKSADQLSLMSDHGPKTKNNNSSSSSSRKNKLKKGSKSVRHMSHNKSNAHEDGTGTVDTTGTASLYGPKPKPRRLLSQPNISLNPEVSIVQSQNASLPVAVVAAAITESSSSSRSSDGPRRAPPKRTPSGDLDMLMNQSVHEHVRKVPSSTEKPKLRRNQSALGKIGKMIGKSTKALINTIPKDLELTKGGNPKKDRGGSFLPENLKTTSKALPKGIKEIDGVLWRVDEDGNKMNKVRHKMSGLRGLGDSAHTASRSSYYSSGEEDDEVDDTMKSCSSLSSFAECNTDTANTNTKSNASIRKQKQKRKPKQKQKGRRSSIDNNNPGKNRTQERPNSCTGGFRPDFGKTSNHTYGSSGKSLRQDSDASLYTDETPTMPNRSQNNVYSVEPLSCDSPHSHRNKNGTPMRLVPKKNGVENHNIVQNLNHRLRNSEKEIARLCRVTLDQEEQMETTKSESKKMREKLKTANREKEALIMEVDKLRLQLDRKSDDTAQNHERTSCEPKDSSQDDSGNVADSDNDSDRLMAKINDLKAVKAALESTMNEQNDRAQARLEAKEDEVRFLQEELERMRSEQGNRHLEYNLKRSGSDDEGSIMSGRRGRRTSMQFVGNIIGNHLKEKAETEKALHQQEIKDLQDRVYNLQSSNEELKTELRKATLEIKDDDDDDMRRAKQAAAEAALVAAHMHNRPNNANIAFKDKVMSLSRMHRSTSDGERSVSQSFRLNRSRINDC